jgi:PAS domain S-box-containing protein
VPRRAEDPSVLTPLTPPRSSGEQRAALHPTLERQLRKMGATTDTVPTPEQWVSLLARVSQSYNQSEQDRGTLERSIALSSHETKALSANVATERDRLSATVASMGDGVCVLDPRGRIEMANPEAERILDAEHGSLRGRSLAAVVAGDGRDFDEPQLARLLSAAASRGSCRSDDARFRTATGLWIAIAFTLTPIGDSGSNAGSVLVFSDMRTRKAAEDALRESESRFRAIFETAAMAIVRVNPDGTIDDCNRAFMDMLGYSREEVVGRDGFAFFHPDDAAQVRARFHAMAISPTSGDLRSERRYLHRNGSTVWVMQAVSFVRGPDGAPLFVIAMLENISDRKHLEMSLRQAQKLEAVGQLAAGIAHEINTPVQFVSDSVHFVRDAVTEMLAILAAHHELRDAASSVLPELAMRATEREKDADMEYLSEQLPKALERALDGLDRVTTIVRGMKAFAHPDRKDMAAASLNDALQATLTIARNEYKYVADVETDFGFVEPIVCHIGELNQVFLNIIVNAAHAIGDVVRDKDLRGHIRVKTWQTDGSAFVAISDSGGGIPEAVRDRVFDPFFTTKEVGKGTGQGLAIARSVVVDKHHGELTFETTKGQGTTFTVRLPMRPVQKGAPAA